MPIPNLKLLGIIIGLLVAPCLQANGVVAGGNLELRFATTWNGKRMTSALIAERGVRITRMDMLLSKLALQTADGEWVESADWHAFVSLGQNKLTAQANGVPAQPIQAIRFTVGLSESEDRQDTSLVPAGHVLHPLVNGLHWGWQGGYVFMALEGQWKRPDSTWGGFSYHYAHAKNAVQVVLPVNFQGGGPVTLSVNWDAAQLMKGLEFEKSGTSTHSRDGDPLVSLFAANLPKSFRVTAVNYDLYQPQAAVTASKQEPAEGTHPYRVNITRRFPALALPADNPLTEEGVALGRALFHDARLSINNTQSCASCHQQPAAFSDSRRVSQGAAGGQGKRQSMPLFNLGWATGFFWDGRAATLREQVLMPVQDPHEMNESLKTVTKKIEDLAPLFRSAFGEPEITPSRMALALEQYLLTLISQESRFDLAVRKQASLTEEEKHGLQLFVTEFDPARGLRGADCFHCHGGTLFTDHQYKNNGLPGSATDQGRMAVTGNPADLGKFKTPSLRNIAVTAPYMHDGRFSTLEEVVEHYSSGVQRSETLDPNLAKHPDAGLQLTTAEKRALVAFLKTLTDERFVGAASPSLPPAGKLARQP